MNASDLDGLTFVAQGTFGIGQIAHCFPRRKVPDSGRCASGQRQPDPIPQALDSPRSSPYLWLPKRSLMELFLAVPVLTGALSFLLYLFCYDDQLEIGS